MAYTKTQVDDMIDRNLNPFRQDIVGDNVIAISADTETAFIANGNARNAVKGPTYFTDRYNTTTGIMTAVTEYDGPSYMSKVGFTWTPTAESEGIGVVRMYINDTTPKLLDSYAFSYKGSLAFPINIFTDWYWGEEAGYDAKNDGVYWTVEFEHAGSVSNPAMLIRHDQ